MIPFEVGHLIQIATVLHIGDKPTQHPTKAWVHVGHKWENGNGAGYRYGLAVGLLKEAPHAFNPKDVLRNCGPHDGKADFYYDLYAHAAKFEATLKETHARP